MNYDVSHEHFDAIRNIIATELNPDAFSNAGTMCENTGATWYEVGIALTAASIAKRMKKGKPNPVAIKKKIDAESFARFLDFAAETQGETRQFISFRKKGLGSLGGPNATIIVDTPGWRIRMLRGETLYHNRLTHTLSDSPPEMKQKDLEDLAREIAVEIGNREIDSLPKREKEAMHKLQDPRSYTGAVPSRDKRSQYMGDTVQILVDVCGHPIGLQTNIFTDNEGDGERTVKELVDQLVIAVGNLDLLTIFRKEVKARVGEIKGEKDLVMQDVICINENTYEENSVTIMLRTTADVVTHTLEDDHQQIAFMSLRVPRNADTATLRTRLAASTHGGYGNLEEYARSIERTVKTRQMRERKQESFTQGTLQVDRIAQELLERIEAYNPEKVQEIMAEGKGNIRVPYKHLEGFIPPRTYVSSRGKNKGKTLPRKTETISFTTNNGRMYASFRLTDAIRWQKARLLMPEYPETVINSLPGKPASDVIDHPLSRLLGPVRNAKATRWGTWVSFHTIHDERSMQTENPKD